MIISSAELLANIFKYFDVTTGFCISDSQFLLYFVNATICFLRGNMKVSNKDAIWDRGPSLISLVRMEVTFILIVAKHDIQIHKS